MQRIALVWVLCLSSFAHSESKAWTAAKKIIPGNVFGVVGVNAGPIRSSELYKTLVPALLDKNTDVKAHLAEVKDTCGLDVSTAIDSLVVGVSEEGKGTIVVAFKGTNQKSLEGCLGKLAKAHGKTFTSSKDGALVHYQMGDQDKDLYMRWLASDIVALATEPSDKDASVAATAGGLAKNADLSGMIGTSKTGSAMWFAFLRQQDLGQFNAKMTGMYGNADLKAADLAVDLHLIVDSDKAATDVANGATSMIPVLVQGGKVPPSMTALVKSLVIKASGKEVVVTAQAPQKDVVDIIGQFMPH
jgi:hypothetical protein